MTIATAVLAATLTTAALTEPKGTWAATIHQAMTALAIGTYGAIVFQAATTIFLPKSTDKNDRSELKERKASSLFAWFIVMLIPLGIMVLSDTLDTTVQHQPVTQEETAPQDTTSPKEQNQQPNDNQKPASDSEDNLPSPQETTGPPKDADTTENKHQGNGHPNK